MMAAHTPGPWTVEGVEIYAEDPVYPVAKTFVQLYARDGRYPAGANARLIAAAPELLEACKAALDFLREDLEDNDPDNNHEVVQELMQVGGALWTAIEKAEGGQ